jgi:CBS domain-containing protein
VPGDIIVCPDDPVRDVLGEQTVTVERDVPARVVAETLANERTGAVLIIAAGEPVGIIAERDVVAAIARGRDLAALDAGDLLEPALVTVAPTDDVRTAARLMIGHHVRHLPIVEDGQIVGVVSALDLLHALNGLDAD